MCADTTKMSEVRELVARAFRVPLLPNEQQQVLAESESWISRLLQSLSEVVPENMRPMLTTPSKTTGMSAFQAEACTTASSSCKTMRESR